MSTLDTAALWSATSLAFDEKKLGAAGLSVRQRKLLALITQPASVPQLAQSIALPDIEVQAALERFAKLGLAQSDAPPPIAPLPMRSARPKAVEEPASRMPLMIGVGVAVLALIAASAWLLRGSGNSAPPEAVSTKAAPTAPPIATGPTDSADNKLSRSAPAATTPAPTAVPAPTVPSVAAKTAPTPAATAAASANTKSAATPPPSVANPLTAIAPAATSIAPVAPTPAPTATVAPPTVTTAAAPTTSLPAAAVTPPPTITPAASPAPVAPVAAAPAKAAPSPAPAREIKLINRVEPGFPRGVDADRGTVRARLQVDARGAVTGVEIVESSPPRVFDRTVRSALQQWRYEPTGEAFTTAAEISFSR